MNLLDLTLPDPAANLACDEALLDWAESDPILEILRFWEAPSFFVVLGYGNHLAQEVNPATCAADGIPILRRCSGGGTVLQGPGCLNFSLILQCQSRPELQSVTATNDSIMKAQADILQKVVGRPVKVQGHTDLTVDNLKFSGNAQRRRRKALLFHGTFLLRFPLDRLERYLRPPPRQPDYRQFRSHREFVINLEVDPRRIKSALAQRWQADAPANTWPEAETERLANATYRQPGWVNRL